jgi:hypothetical protein
VIIQDEIARLEIEIDLMEDVAETARRRVDGEDEEWEAHRRKVLDSMCRMVLEFKIEDQPSKAVAILGRLFNDAREITAQQQIVDQFDKKKKTLHHLLAERERQSEAQERSRELYDRQSWRRATD